MNIKDLMSGIGVVIDDAYKKDNRTEDDKILRLVESIENEWKIPICKYQEIPSEDVCNNLIQSASFILLDWKLWPNNSAAELEKSRIEENIKFLEKARDYFRPVFIFTNENVKDIIEAISPHDLYNEQYPGKNFIFIQKKSHLTGKKLFSSIKDWIGKNSSVYTLKTWEQALYKSKENLFGLLYKKSPSWPRVFWTAYKKDGIDPSSSMVYFINSNLLARMETNIFEDKILGKRSYRIECKDLKSVLEGASFIPQEKLHENDVRSGDIFKTNSRYLINIRADCDCIPRKGQSIDRVELYCLEGNRLNKKDIKNLYDDKLGNFNECVWQTIVFMVDDGKTIQFSFKKLVQKRFLEIKTQRVGRLIHPYITRIQQRYSFYLQRQGLPRIPKEAIRGKSEE